MPAAPALAITGASGAFGRLTAEELARAGAPLRLLARHPARAPQLPGSIVLHADYADARDTAAALAGAETLLLVSIRDQEAWLRVQLETVAAAADAGVQHVVYTSFQSAGARASYSRAREHFAVEESIRASGMRWTMLRPSFLLDLVALMPSADDALLAPDGDVLIAAVSRMDVARCAAAVLRDPAAHADRTYELTGPHALSPRLVAEVLGRSSGRAVRFEPVDLEGVRRVSEAAGLTDRRLEARLSAYRAAVAGEFAPVTDDVERLTGVPPISLETLVGL